MRYRQLHLMLLATLSCALAGCDPGTELSSGGEFGEPDADELRAFPTGSYWDAVRCDVDDPDLCYGHRAGTDADLWSQVYSQNYIDSLVTQGMLELSGDGWDKSTCDPGNEPTTAPDVQCYQFVNTATRVCLAGEDGWAAEARPSCDVGPYAIDDYWAAGSCSVTLGDLGFDDVLAHSSIINRARAFIDTDAFDVRPECYVDSLGLVDVDPNGRRPIVEVSAFGYGRWSGDDVETWSMLTEATEFESEIVEVIDVPPEFDCHPNADVDVCAVIDAQGHKGCFWYVYGGDYVVPVAPSCYMTGSSWQWVGNGMSAVATQN